MRKLVLGVCFVFVGASAAVAQGKVAVKCSGGACARCVPQGDR